MRPGEESLLTFAADLRSLRVKANGPAYRELGRRVHYSAATLSEAASGRKLPSLAVTLAYVRGCDGDVVEWERRWREVAAELTDEPSSVEEDDQSPPYIGLNAFQPEHVEKFFGRARLIDEVLTGLAAHRLVAVFGPSGAGKSSLLRAGVIARWRGPSRQVVLLTPGEHPLAELDGLPDGRETLIVVDQFEEVFTRCADAAERAEFIGRLVALADDPSGPHRLLLGVRADFYGHCMDSPELLAHLRDAQVAVGAMTVEELREAIVEPATRAGARVESSLLTALVAQVSGHAGLLPLLSHALLETWRRRRGNTLTLSGFEAAGGIDGALAKTAEDLYAEFEPEQQTLVRQLFLRLTAIGGDAKARVGRDELDGDPGMTFVLERLAVARLVTLDKDSVEMTHEALLRSWPRLCGWLTEDRDGRRVHRQLTEAANTWESLDRDPGALYRGIRLESAREWDSRAGEPLTVRERQFLDASLATRDQEQTRERRQRLRLRQLVAVLSVLLVVAVAATGYAFRAEFNASEERNIAVSQRVAIEAAALRATNPALAAQLSLAAYRLSPTPEARGSLLDTVAAPYAAQLLGHTGPVGGVAYSADGKLMATASMDRTVRLWDVRIPHHPKEITSLIGHADGVNAVAFGHGVLATASWDNTVGVWDITDPAHPVGPIMLKGHTGAVTAVAISPDGRTLVSGSVDHTIRVWDLADPKHPAPVGDPIAAHDNSVLTVAFRGDGKLLATSGGDQMIRLWDMMDPRHPVAAGTPLSGHTGNVGATAFSRDGHMLVSGSADRTLRLWDVTDPSHPTLVASVAAAHADEIRSVAFSPDGRTIASVSLDRMVRLWTVGNGGLFEAATFAGHTAAVYGAAFSPDGRTLATTSDDHTVRLWDAAGSILGGHTNAVLHVAFSPDGQAVATAGYDGTILVRGIADPAQPDPPTILTGHGGPVNSVVFSPDGRTLASASADHTVRFWDVHDRRHITPLGDPLTVYKDAVNTVAYSRDGKLLATGGSDRVVLLWDMTNPGPPRAIASMDVPAGIDEVAFSRDGRRLAVASDDGRTRLWPLTDPASPSAPVTLEGHKAAVKSVAFSPDGRLLATASDDHTVRLWNLDNPADEIAPLVFPDRVYSLAFNGDGTQLATANADGRVRLSDISDRAHPTELVDLDAHTDRVYSVAFSPDGHTLASASQDHTARLWDTDPERVAARVCAVTDPLGRADWDRYFPGLDYHPPC